MKISEVKIEKFRSIKKASFRMKDITAVVGENNAGKTGVLRALNAVLNFEAEEKDFVNKSHRYLPRSNTKIVIVFTDVPNKKIYENRTHNGKLTLNFLYNYNENRKKFSITNGRDTENVDDFFMEELAKDIMYVYIPASRNNNDVGWNDDSIFKRLIIDYTAKYTKNRDNISNHVRSATDKIHEYVLKKLEKEINELYMQNKDVDFEISFPDNLDYTVLLGNIELSLNESKSKHLLKDWGSGTKSLAVIAMHRANALLKNGSIVLGIEEPETNLHPQAQKRFIMSLRNKRHLNETQSIFTTHSTALVDELDHEDIVLVRRRKDSKKGYISNVTQLSKDFWEKYGIEKFKHYQYFGYKNSDFFFSKYVVIGESKNDCQVFEKLVSPKIGDKIADVSFLDAGGVENIKYPFFLLKELDIPFSIVVDRDLFFEYLNNNNLNDSRDNNGLPIYGEIIKNEEVLNHLFKEDKKSKLINLHKNGYRKFFDYIKNFGIVSMNYCLEMDLSCSSKAREEYYKILKLTPDNQNQKYLLEKNYNSIKKIKNIMEILNNIPYVSYPESYKKIRNYLTEEINKYIN